MNIPHFAHKKQLVLATLIATSLISTGTSATFVNSVNAKSLESPENLISLNQSDDSLPVGVINAVSREIVRTYRVPQSQLRVTSIKSQTWSDSCFGLGTLTEICARTSVNGWRVTMSDNTRSWTYRTDSTGRAIREETQGNINNSNLPQAVSDLVLRTASERTSLRISELRITKSEQLTVDGCLGLARPGEACTRIAQRAWEVTVEARQQRLVYRTNQNATQIRFNEAASNVTDNNNNNLPQSIASAVLRFAATDFGVSSSQLRITRTEQQTWRDGCLGLPRPTERCMGTPTPGWRVMVVSQRGASRKAVQVYRTDSTGDRIRSEAINDEVPGNNELPNSVSISVLRDISRRANISISQLRIVKAEQREWPNGCLGLGTPGVMCTQAIVPGWRVTAEGGGQTFIYRTNASGSVIKSETGASQGGITPVPISRNEIPPLAEGVVFRAISSGGFANLRTETVLMNDGRVLQTNQRGINRRFPQQGTQIAQISRQEVRQFLQILEQQRFSQFDLLSFPAPSGAADFMGVTLTSQSTTTGYADIVQDKLPESLRSVILAWNQIVSRSSR